MKRIIFLLVAVATLAGVIAFKARASHHSATQEAAPIFVTQIPDGYRDWRLVSVAHEEGNLNSFASILGNDIAIKAYREGRLPSRTAPSLPHCITVSSRQRKTTKPLAVISLSLPGSDKCSIYGQRLKEVRRDRRLGFRSFQQRREDSRRCVHENLLPLSPENERARPGIHPLLTLRRGTAAERNETICAKKPN